MIIHVKLFISRIKDDNGVWLKELMDIKSHVVPDYERLLSEDSVAPDYECMDKFLILFLLC